MTTFVYKAKKNTAETVTGKIQALNQDEAIDIIHQLGLHPVAVEPQTKEDPLVLKHKTKKVSTKALFIFSRQLANLLKSGVTLLRALLIIEEQISNRFFRKVIYQIALGVKNGNSLSECLTEYPAIFSTLYIALVHAGEESGNLQEMLLKVSDYQRKQEDIRSKVKMALAYPCLMTFVGIATIYFILTFVLPKMMGLFENIGESLPIPTLVLIQISQILRNGWLGTVFGILLFIFFGKQFIKSQKGRFVSSRFLLNLPLFGDLIRKTELGRFCRTLLLLLKSGVPILRALDIAIPVLNNVLLKKHMMLCKKDLAVGGTLGESIKLSQEIPTMMGHLIAVGEESGNLNEVLGEIADNYEQETDEKIKIMSTLLEPVMILVIGGIVGFIVFAMLLPIFQIDVLAG